MSAPSSSIRMLATVREVSELVATLSYGPGSWWHVFRDEDGDYQARAYWSDLVQRPHAVLGDAFSSMEAAAEDLEWRLRQEVARMHDFQEVPTVHA